VARLVEALGIGVVAGHADEPPVVAVGPAVIKALEPTPISLTLRADDGTAMPTGIEQAVEGAPLVAAEDDRPAGNLARAEITGLFQLGSVPHIDPAVPEDLRHLRAQDIFRNQYFTVEQEGFFLAVVDDIGARRHSTCLRWDLPTYIVVRQA
jgi:hypothetical protein